MRYLKMLFTAEYQKKENINLNLTSRFLLIGILSLFLLLNEIGRCILFFLAIILIIAIGMTAFYVFMSDLIAIFKKFEAKKFQWEINEEFVEEYAEVKEESSKQIVEDSLPYYFLDNTALQHYSGAFYISVLTQVFNHQCVTEEKNAKLITSQKFFDEIKVLEENPDNKEIFNGYSYLIKNNFEVLPMNSDELLVSEIFNLYEKYSNLTFVTKDKMLASAFEGSMIKVKVLE